MGRIRPTSNIKLLSEKWNGVRISRRRIKTRLQSNNILIFSCTIYALFVCSTLLHEMCKKNKKRKATHTSRNQKFYINIPIWTFVQAKRKKWRWKKDTFWCRVCEEIDKQLLKKYCKVELGLGHVFTCVHVNCMCFCLFCFIFFFIQPEVTFNTQLDACSCNVTQKESRCFFFRTVLPKLNGLELRSQFC